MNKKRIRAAREFGFKVPAIAIQYGISEDEVRRICRRKIGSHFKTHVDYDLLRRWASGGHSTRALASMFNLPEEQVIKILDTCEYKSPKTRAYAVRRMRKGRLYKLMRAGASAEDIASALKMSMARVRAKMDKVGRET